MARSVMARSVLRIALVSDAVYPYSKGGKETRLYQLSTRLATAGHDVHIYTMHWWDGAETTRRENGVTLHAICRRHALYAGGRRSIRQGLLFGLACWKLISERFDVLDVDQIPFFPLFPLRIISWLKRRPLIATWHEVWGRLYWQEYLGRAGWIAYAIERCSIHLPSRLITVSSLTTARAGSMMRHTNRIAHIANGIDFNHISRIKPAKAGADIIYVGRLIEHKHVDVLLEALAIIARHSPNIACLIVGDGPERASLEAQAERLGIANNVAFVGFIPDHDDVLASIKSSRVFVLPSTREGFGISLLEAYACGRPAVTINHPDNAARELISPETGRLAELSATSLAQQLADLLTKPLDSHAITSIARRHDWSEATRQLLNLYESLEP